MVGGWIIGTKCYQKRIFLWRYSFTCELKLYTNLKVGVYITNCENIKHFESDNDDEDYLESWNGADE